MKSIRIMGGAIVLAAIVWVIQQTPYAFLSKDAADFVGGLTVGLLIATAVAWFATR